MPLPHSLGFFPWESRRGGIAIESRLEAAPASLDGFAGEALLKARPAGR